MSLLKSKIRFYNSMATMQEAGVTLVNSLKHNHTAPFGNVGKQMAYAIEEGDGTLSEIMRFYPEYFTPVECSMIKAGEDTGRLDHIFKALAESYEFKLEVKRIIISGLTFPALQYHAAALLIPVISAIIGITCPIVAVLQFLGLTFGPYILLLLVWLMMKTPLKDSIAVIFLNIPLLGTIIRKINYSSFFRTYSMAAEAGLPVARSVRLGAETCSNFQIKKSFLKTADIVESEGIPFFDAFKMTVMNSINSSSIALAIMETGDLTGTSDQTARKVADTLREEWMASVKTLSKVIPIMIYLAIVLYMAIMVIIFFSKIFAQMNAY